MAQKGAWLLHIIGNEAPPAESNSVARRFVATKSIFPGTRDIDRPSHTR